MFNFAEGIPPELSPYCQIENNTLTCQSVPSLANAISYYNFYLQAVPTSTSNVEEGIIEIAPTVAIAPPLPTIQSFTHNGAEASASPKRIVRMSAGQSPIYIDLAWSVENAAQIELLPAPGRVTGSSIRYLVSSTSGNEVVQLKVTNESGEVVTQSIVIEKIVQSARPAAASQR